MRHAVTEVGQPDEVEHLGDRDAVSPVDEAVPDVAGDGHVREQGVVLEHHAHPRRSGGRLTDSETTVVAPMVTEPESGSSKPAMTRSAEVLPHPDGPSRLRI